MTEEKDEEYLGWYITWREQWSQFFRKDNWYTFNINNIEVENDKIMGGFEATVIILGLGCTIRRNHTITEDASYIKEQVDSVKEGKFTGVETDWVETAWYIDGESVDKDAYQEYLGLPKESK